MRILITTGIFEPETGGPATYAPRIADKLIEAGNEVTVITYSDKETYDADQKYPFRLVRVVRGKNKLANYARFFRTALRELEGKDVAYSLDWIAAGFPLTLAAMIKRVPVVIRVGGDYIWERYLQLSNPPMPLMEFYDRGLHKNFRTLSRVISFVLNHAFVIFNSDIQRTMYQKLYGLNPKKTAVVYNPTPKRGSFGVTREKAGDEIVYAGRFIAMKNIITLLEVYAKTRSPYRLVLIGSGPEEHRIRNAIQELRINERVTILPSMAQKELFERIKNARALVLPSWTDIAPNEVNEAVALGIPILVTKENFLPFREQLPEMIDPRSVDDIALKLEMLADEKRYQFFVDSCQAIRFEHGWDDVVRQHLTIFLGIHARG